MKKNQRNSQGKAIKWCETRYGRQYLGRRFFAKHFAVMQISQGCATIESIKSSTAPKIKKSIAIAEATIATYKATAAAYKYGLSLI